MKSKHNFKGPYPDTRTKRRKASVRSPPPRSHLPSSPLLPANRGRRIVSPGIGLWLLLLPETPHCHEVPRLISKPSMRGTGNGFRRSGKTKPWMQVREMAYGTATPFSCDVHCRIGASRPPHLPFLRREAPAALRLATPGAR
jgi:hypothetical protein